MEINYFKWENRGGGGEWGNIKKKRVVDEKWEAREEWSLETVRQSIELRGEEKGKWNWRKRERGNHRMIKTPTLNSQQRSPSFNFLFPFLSWVHLCFWFKCREIFLTYLLFSTTTTTGWISSSISTFLFLFSFLYHLNFLFQIVMRFLWFFLFLAFWI